MAKSASYEVYNQVAHPSAGASVPPTKGGEITEPCEALGNPGRLKRGVGPAATVRTPQEAINKQLGSNIELTWERKK